MAERKSVQVFRMLVHELKTRPAQLTPELPIGLKEVDECLWGLRRGELMVVAGRPSSGKTSFALHLALEVARHDKKVLFFSLEESTPELLKRIISRCGEIDNTKIKHYDLSEKNKKTMEAVFNLFTDWNFGVMDSVRKLEDIIKWTREYDKQHDLVCVFVDYIQLLDWSNFQQKRLAIEHYIIELRRLAQQLNLVIVVCSQINRAPEGRKDKHPGLGELKEAGALEETSDVVLGLYYPCREETQKKHSNEEMEVMVLKNRHGPTGRFEVRFIPEYYKFLDK